MENVDELCKLIQETVGETQGAAGEEIRPDTPLLVSGLLDSLTIMKIVTQVEERTGAPFPETSVVAANFRTPAALWDAVEAARGAASSGSALS
ncbi:acyl carrier protein [Streptomyces sp. HK10]|uniref:acyl carrier protein n=1 Tax=Streptomyces sp. HK10 TaxID=3373255 RepID=UPI003747852A